VLKLHKNEAEAAATVLRDALTRPLPPDQRQTLLVTLLHDAINAGKALDGYRAAPDAVAAFAVLADALADRQLLAELQQLIDAHRMRQPDDVWLNVATGLLHLREQKWPEAAQAFGEAWPRLPAAAHPRIQYNYVLALYKAGRWMDAYHTVASRPQTFHQLATLFVQDKKGAELLTLVQQHRPHAGNDPGLFFYEARAHFLLFMQPDLALESLEKAYRSQANWPARRQYVEALILDMHAAGQGRIGYRRVPDPVVAFETLARQLVLDKNLAELDQLLAEHSQLHGNDPALAFFRGERALLAGDPLQAAQAFATAVSGGRAAQYWIFRNGLHRAHLRARTVAKAYQAANGTFPELARLCQQEKDADQLTALIAAHRENDPDDPSLPAWEIEVQWLRQDYAGALKLLEAHRADLAPHPRLGMKFDSHLVRALVKLKRTDEAVRAAEALANRPNRRLLQLLAYAAAGNVERALAVVDPQATPFLLRSYYADPDLGPLLRGEPLRAFRERYPEPK
jgi:hypothetical protein